MNCTLFNVTVLEEAVSSAAFFFYIAISFFSNLMLTCFMDPPETKYSAGSLKQANA